MSSLFRFGMFTVERCFQVPVMIIPSHLYHGLLMVCLKKDFCQKYSCKKISLIHTFSTNSMFLFNIFYVIVIMWATGTFLILRRLIRQKYSVVLKSGCILSCFFYEKKAGINDNLLLKSIKQNTACKSVVYRSLKTHKCCHFSENIS